MIKLDRQSLNLKSPIVSQRFAGIFLLLLGIALTLVACEDHHNEPVTPNKGTAPGASRQSLELPLKKIEKKILVSKVDFVPAAPKPIELLAEDVSCVTSACHASFATAIRIHGPVAMNNCSACHEEDQGNHAYPLKRTGDAICTFCHTVTGMAANQHKAIANDGCMTCHDPHVSRIKFLLTADNIEQLCQRCHDIPYQKYAHGPFATGQCTLCHQPHESNFKHLLRGSNEPEQCFGCHIGKKTAMAISQKVHKPAAEKCSTCHNPHASPFPFELHEPINDTCLSCHEDIAQMVHSATVSHDALFMEQGCANCHDAHASQDMNLLKDRDDKLCLQCHNKPLEGHDGRTIPDMRPALQQTFLHGPVRSGDCTACHNVHGSTHERLLVETFPKTFYAGFDLENYALCFTCHDKELVFEPKTRHLTEFRQGSQNLHYLHVNREVKGRSCKACHEIHGSNQPSHLAESVPFEGSGWSMPMRYKKLPDGGRCAPGCHEPKTYDRNKMDPIETIQSDPLKPSDVVPETGRP